MGRIYRVLPEVTHQLGAACSEQLQRTKPDGRPYVTCRREATSSSNPQG